MSTILYPHSQTIRNCIWGLLQGQIDCYRLFYMTISVWICVLHTKKNCSGNVCTLKMLPHFCIDQIACASLECLFFGKNTVIDDDTFFCKDMLLHPCSISFTFVSLKPFMWTSGPVAGCSLCLGFVYSDKILYKHKCLQWSSSSWNWPSSFLLKIGWPCSLMTNIFLNNNYFLLLVELDCLVRGLPSLTMYIFFK